MTHEHSPEQVNIAEIRVLKLRTPMALLLMVILLTTMWGWANRSRNDEILEQLEALHKKIDAIAPIKTQ